MLLRWVLSLSSVAREVPVAGSPMGEGEAPAAEGDAGSVSQRDSLVGHTAGGDCGDDVSVQYCLLVICLTDEIPISCSIFIVGRNFAGNPICLTTASKGLKAYTGYGQHWLLAKFLLRAQYPNVA